MEEDAAFVDGEEGSGRFDLFKDDIAVVGDVDYCEVAVFGVANGDAFGWLGTETLVTMIKAQSVLDHSLLSNFWQLLPEVGCILIRTDRHLKSSALDVSFEH